MTETEKIIDGLKRGDLQILEQVYRRHREEFIFWAHKNFKQKDHDVLEYYHQAILILYENAVSGKIEANKSSIKTYLFAIGKNKLRESIRHDQKNQSMNIELMDEQLDLIEKIKFEGKLDHVEKALTELGEPCASLLTYFYYQRLTIPEITAKLGYKNNDTTKNIKYKCIQRLRKLMNSKGTGK